MCVCVEGGVCGGGKVSYCPKHTQRINFCSLILAAIVFSPIINMLVCNNNKKAHRAKYVLL